MDEVEREVWMVAALAAVLTAGMNADSQSEASLSPGGAVRWALKILEEAEAEIHARRERDR